MVSVKYKRRVEMKKFLLSLLMIGLVTTCHDEQTQRSLAPCHKHEEVINKDNSVVYAEVLAADAVYKMTYVPQPNLFAPKKVIVVTCMDYRIDLTALGLGGTYVLRNAGGRVTEDVLRSLVIAQKLLGAEEIFLIQHTDCGMQKFTKRVMNDLLEKTIVTATLVKNCNTTLYPLQDNNVCKWKNTSKCCGKKPCNDYECINWLTINHGLFNSVLEDVKTIRNHPLIPSDVPIYGFIFDVISGDLIPVPKATKAGRAKPQYCK